MNKALGDLGEAAVANLLRARGYAVQEIGGNFPVIDLVVSGAADFRVSVKTSALRQHVRMGRETSVTQLLDTDFVFAVMPRGGASLDLADGVYSLLIIPGLVARTDAIRIHHAYLEAPSRDGGERTGSAGIIVKGYASRHAEVWKRWAAYEGRWDLLPAPASS